MHGSPADTEHTPGTSDHAGDGPPPSAQTPRDLGELASSLYGGAGDSLRGARDSALALGALLRADLALARSALLHGAVCTLIAVTLLGATWLLLVALAVVLMHAAGLSLAASLAVVAAATAIAGAAFVMLARSAFADTNFSATRRQLAALTSGGQPARDDEHARETGQ